MSRCFSSQKWERNPTILAILASKQTFLKASGQSEPNQSINGLTRTTRLLMKIMLASRHVYPTAAKCFATDPKHLNRSKFIKSIVRQNYPPNSPRCLAVQRDRHLDSMGLSILPLAVQVCERLHEAQHNGMIVYFHLIAHDLE